jgi:hypothetical protein
VPLNTWTDFVASSSAQFESYVARLETAGQLSERYRVSGEDEIDLRQARDDVEILSDIRWQTKGWKQTLNRVAQLGQLVDAILQIDLRGELEASEAGDAETQSGFSSLQRRFKEVQSRTTAKGGDLREWVLHPFVEVRDRVRQLPGQVQHLSHGVALLEVLFDLELAEVRACMGEIPATQARVVGVRVATSVLLPELARELEQARQRAARYEAWLERLTYARDAGEVDGAAYSILSEEYHRDLEASRSRLAVLENRADTWRRDGQAITDSCADWMKLELSVLDARRLAEQSDAAVDHRTVLLREMERLDEARRLLGSF